MSPVYQPVSGGGGGVSQQDVDASIATHAADTSTHGAADISALATAAALTAHESDTSNVHGITDTTVLASDAELATHAALLTGVHGDILTRLASDFSTASGSAVDVTDFVAAMEASADYEVEGKFIFSTPTATTNGIGYGLNGPASPVRVSYGLHYFGFAGDGGGGVFGGAGTAYDDIVTMTAVVANATIYVATLHGIIRNGVNAGNLQVRVLSDAGGGVSVTTYAGSFLRLSKISA